MRNFILALLAVVSVSLNAQTSIQFQSHVPVGTATNSKFSAYIADSSFNETSHLNSQAIWFVENVDVTVANGVINVTLENIPNSVFLTADRTNLFVYSYVNGLTVGRLPFHKVPYALVSEYTLNSASSKNAEQADTAKYAHRAKFADSTTVASLSNRSTLSDLAATAISATRADSAVAAHRAVTAGTANQIKDSILEARHFTANSVRLFALSGSDNASVGSYLTKGANGISWEINPQYRTSHVTVASAPPATIANTVRYFVSRVAFDYDLNTVVSPQNEQLITICNNSTSNLVKLDRTTWNLDSPVDVNIFAGQSRTLWFNGTNWIVVQ
jgi:hypothetical protein